MRERFFTIYKITNQVNGKFYVGKHITDDLDDDYMGSGKLIRVAIRTYGRENFVKEYLEVLDNEWQMNLAERILVVRDSESYNLCPGGKGGWGFLNDGSEAHRERATRASHKAKKIPPNCSGRKLSERTKQKLSASRLGKPGHKHSESTKEKMSSQRRGKKSGQESHWFGCFWITDGIQNKRIKGEIPVGWRRGRITGG